MTFLIRELLQQDKLAATSAHLELAVDDFTFLPFYEPDEPWPDYLARMARMRPVGDPQAGIVPWIDLYAVIDGVVVGRVSVRLGLTDDLKRSGGHIGYGVRPAARRRGCATALLRAGLEVAHANGINPALVTCGDSNIGSATVIENCGGVLENRIVEPDGSTRRRYWVPTG